MTFTKNLPTAVFYQIIKCMENAQKYQHVIFLSIGNNNGGNNGNPPERRQSKTTLGKRMSKILVGDQQGKK